jgi:hypothetical protein
MKNVCLKTYVKILLQLAWHLEKELSYFKCGIAQIFCKCIFYESVALLKIY